MVEESPEERDGALMRVVKIFVIVGALALVVGVAVLISRFKGHRATQAELPAESSIAVAAGQGVLSITPVDGNLAVLLGDEQGREILFYNARGRLLHRVRLQTAQGLTPP